MIWFCIHFIFLRKVAIKVTLSFSKLKLTSLDQDILAYKNKYSLFIGEKCMHLLQSWVRANTVFFHNRLTNCQQKMNTKYLAIGRANHQQFRNYSPLFAPIRVIFVLLFNYPIESLIDHTGIDRFRLRNDLPKWISHFSLNRDERKRGESARVYKYFSYKT